MVDDAVQSDPRAICRRFENVVVSVIFQREQVSTQGAAKGASFRPIQLLDEELHTATFQVNPAFTTS
jgi:hypothetical protein